MTLLLLHNTKTHSHMFMRTFRGHRDPEDDIHYIKWHGFSALSSEKNVSLSACDVSPETSKRRGRKRRGAKCAEDAGGGVMLLLLSSFPCSVCLRASQWLLKCHFKAFCFNLVSLYFVVPLFCFLLIEQKRVKVSFMKVR